MVGRRLYGEAVGRPPLGWVGVRVLVGVWERVLTGVWSFGIDGVSSGVRFSSV